MTGFVPTLPQAPADVAYLETLTDEELAVLDDSGLDGAGPIAVRPRFDDLSAAQQDVARQVAFRGLLARGIVDPPSAEAVAAAEARGGSPTTPVDVLVRQDVQSLVTLRRGAALVVALARTTSAGQDYWYAYSLDDLALIEEVTDSGLHRFSLVRDDQLLDLVVASAIHPDTADATGSPVAMPDDPAPGSPPPDPPPPVLQTLGQALLRVDFVVRHHGRVAAQTVSLFTGPAGSWLVAHREAEPSVAYPMRSHELREHVRATVREAGVRCG
jgi:hypothetical protein